ncbi:TPA: hypothetical protein ACF0RW_000235 [Legionella pneumophila]|nr:MULTISPECIES: hypothetical protein [Legionella]MDW8902023.1 hypothetical protein [Legionella pneumophila]MDW8907377.1 hypothetical protein [Legionella pneumophila]CZG39213.1 Uncharacterised protein [Legionella pneumophila]STX84369.1 Uncharacterised protein [Legionella pneumophila]HBB6896807.1 hypothetical protein [Legionella pneumophila]
MKQCHWIILACCLALAACMNNSTSTKNTESLDSHVAQGHVGHGGGGGR